MKDRISNINIACHHYISLAFFSFFELFTFSPDVTTAMLVHRTMKKNVYREFESIIMQNMSHFNKLMSVFHASVLLLIMNFVITLSK